jgi:hypothetical protein
MPLPTAAIDNRTYQDLLDEARNRIPVHNPEWTNFNKSDPGVTLLELFAFLTESLLYRVNQIPDRNRRKFLSLLGVPLQPATPARGLVAFANERGPLRPVTLADGLEVRARAVPFRTEQGLDVLPVEARAYCKQPKPLSDADKPYYEKLYTTYLDAGPPKELRLYEAVPLPADGIDLGSGTVDGAVWVALLIRGADKPAPSTPPALDAVKAEVRRQLANRTLSLGVAPLSPEPQRSLTPAGRPGRDAQTLLQVQVPRLPAGGLLPDDPAQRVARYVSLPAVFPGRSVLAEPGVVQVTLPDAAGLGLWANFQPQESGTGDFPPALDDTALNDRLVTWLRVSPRDPDTDDPAKLRVGLLWVGVNAAAVTQRAHVAGESLPDGTGEPDQSAALAQAPVLPGSVRLTVVTGGQAEEWREIDDLAPAGPEVPTPDPRQPPGTAPPPPRRSKVFALDAEAGRLRFGNGLAGFRPPFGARLFVSYDVAAGAAGNVGPNAIDGGPLLPAGLKVTNPLPTWGGAEAETVDEGERQIPRYLQHRDRLVNAADFETIALRTPGADLARVDVLPAFNPELGDNAPGDTPGAVTLMVVPRWDPRHPDTPEPDQHVLDTVCDYLEPRRLVTTELFLRGPVYKPVWVTVGIQAAGGLAIAPVCAAVRQALTDFLSPLPGPPGDDGEPTRPGWPRTKPVVAMELLAVASRVDGVLLVNGVTVAGDGGAADKVDFVGLELPRLAGLSVVGGDPVPLEELRGQGPPPPPPSYLPVPAVPEEC